MVKQTLLHTTTLILIVSISKLLLSLIKAIVMAIPPFSVKAIIINCMKKNLESSIDTFLPSCKDVLLGPFTICQAIQPIGFTIALPLSLNLLYVVARLFTMCGWAYSYKFSFLVVKLTFVGQLFWLLYENEWWGQCDFIFFMVSYAYKF